MESKCCNVAGLRLSQLQFNVLSYQDFAGFDPCLTDFSWRLNSWLDPQKDRIAQFQAAKVSLEVKVFFHTVVVSSELLALDVRRNFLGFCYDGLPKYFRLNYLVRRFDWSSEF